MLIKRARPKETENLNYFIYSFQALEGLKRLLVVPTHINNQVSFDLKKLFWGVYRDASVRLSSLALLCFACNSADVDADFQKPGFYLSLAISQIENAVNLTTRPPLFLSFSLSGIEEKNWIESPEIEIVYK